MIPEYAKFIKSSQKKAVQRGSVDRFGNGIIERLDRTLKEILSIPHDAKGYRFSNSEDYAFYDVYWQRVSDHYLI